MVTRVLIVDDHVIVREGLVSLFNSSPDYQVVGEAGTAEAAIRLARESHPDLILMDFSLPDQDGTAATRAILSESPDIAVVFLTIHETDDRLFAALRSGAKGYLIKNIPGQKLLASLRALNKNEPAISRNMMMNVIHEFAQMGPRSEPDKSHLADLSLRELDVMRELAEDASNHEIAVRLSVSDTTVKNHVHNILTKLGLKNRQDLARFARHQGLGRYAMK